MLSSRICRYWRDPVRTAANAACAPFDFFGYAWACLSQLAYMAVVSWGSDRDPGMLLIGSSFALLTFTLAWLVARRRPFYVRWREPLALLGAVHFSVSDVEETLRSKECYVENHNGSTLRLLALLCIHNPAILLFVYSVYGRLPMGWSMYAQPVLALYPLIRGKPLCERALGTAGTPQLLAALRRRLGAVFGTPMLGALAIMGTGAASPMYDCLALNAFTMAMCVVILPLLALRHFERQRRYAYAGQQRQQQRLQGRLGLTTQRQQPWSSWESDEGNAGSDGSGDESGQGWQMRHQWGHELAPNNVDEAVEEVAVGQGSFVTLFNLYLCCCLAWAGSTSLAAHLTGS